MSGGSMDYVYNYVDDAASMTHDPEFSELLRDAAYCSNCGAKVVE